MEKGVDAVDLSVLFFQICCSNFYQYQVRSLPGLVTHSVTAGVVETFSDISYMTPTWVGCSTIIYNYNQWPLERVVARSRFQNSMAKWFYGAFLCIELTHDFNSKIRPWTYGQILTWSLTIFGPFLRGKNGQNKPENQQNWNMFKSCPKVIKSQNKSHRDHFWGMFEL